jgi:hypothetical protein
MKKTFLYILAAGFFGGLTLMSFDGGAQTAEQQISAKVEAAKTTFMAEQDAACKAKALAAAQAEFAAMNPVVAEPVIDPKTGKPSKTKPTPTPTPTPAKTGGDATGGQTTTTTTTTTTKTDPKDSKMSGDKTTTTDAKDSKISGDKTTTTDKKDSKMNKGGN